MKQELIETLIRLFERDLDKLSQEIKQYPDEATIWQIRGAIKNSAGNLCLHLCGNMQHYIGRQIGKTSYVRNRDLEFSEKFRSRESLLAEIATTREAVIAALKQLDPGLLETTYPEDVFGYPMTYSFFLVHLAGHFNYHLGQINYHRRLA